MQQRRRARAVHTPVVFLLLAASVLLAGKDRHAVPLSGRGAGFWDRFAFGYRLCVPACRAL
ncbi:hypothetical protein METBIDRAFT_32347 [Metschnikowia bicuspidata var. bicuspidata NRRL YB-4993]|uniref:Uncharacterized protein n=1 Tax=Metschnikowia bicuspidata var. bicuspidata NRRL YB-4993 TaxID=869754 RepID=A0A1A0H8L5_9ASCO|nr:hypothetical protein METBIDRAFT_32347 [Metschnikowia bicuspidata var. bicuspidata NRRL YB-4993]OBA20335.1 hypothetical protein METBIDRAFT_32347 [Metschnikowia bicuspidata var. bicuspidata NRRL YB-4993]